MKEAYMCSIRLIYIKCKNVRIQIYYKMEGIVPEIAYINDILLYK